MSKRILLGCYEVPGWGGANTSGYNLFRRMQQDGFTVSYVNIIDEQDADFFRYVYGESYGNPGRLNNVHNCVLAEDLFHRHPGLGDLTNRLSPDVMVGIGYIAALLLKTAAPGIPLVFLTAGCTQVTTYLSTRRSTGIFTLAEFLERVNGGCNIFHAREKEAVQMADLVVPHSFLIRDLFECVFPFETGKVLPDVIWRTEWIVQDARCHAALGKPFFDRDIDVIFVANSWLRREKNYGLVKKLAGTLRGLNIHVVGEVQETLPGAVHHGLLTRRRNLFALLGRSKTLVCPSLFDAAPGILWEASVMGCNVVATRNCGNWMLCNKRLVADPFCLNIFLDKIRLSLNGKLEDNMDYFLRSNSYQNLIDTLAVI